jgi:hypothetical protein
MVATSDRFARTCIAPDDATPTDCDFALAGRRIRTGRQRRWHGDYFFHCFYGTLPAGEYRTPSKRSTQIDAEANHPSILPKLIITKTVSI